MLTPNSAARLPLRMVSPWVEVIQSKPLAAGEVETTPLLLVEERRLGTLVVVVGSKAMRYATQRRSVRLSCYDYAQGRTSHDDKVFKAALTSS